MVLQVAESLIPYFIKRCFVDTKNKWKDGYRCTKKYGIGSEFYRITGTGFVKSFKEAATDEVKRHAKLYISGILIDTGLTYL